MTITENTESKQRELVFGKKPEINLVKPCKIGEGILQHLAVDKQYFISKFKQSNKQLKMFIPASGSGSRMFHFLFDFLENPNDENRGKVERFLNHLDDFAFSRKIATEIRTKLSHNEIDLEEFVNYIVNQAGLNYGHRPKGLIPFHQYGYFILNPFQEQVLQAVALNNGVSSVHFTVNPKFEAEIKSSINQVAEISGYQFSIDFSSQNTSTDSLAFSKNGEAILTDEGGYLTRPSGHGALLSNLNNVDAEIVFIKNIDNLQHQKQMPKSSDEIAYLSGVLLNFNEEISTLFKQNNMDRKQLEDFLNKYELCSNSQTILNLPDAELKLWLNKPRRVCGMVKNEGQAGGGPFWVVKNGNISKQIIEKAQINLSSEQYNVMIKSSHFNPVMMACMTKGLQGEKLNLENFCDNESYFIVNKQYKGKSVRFLEQPGLWNGGMADWHTVFVEVPSSAFSPVKIVLDLLDEAHQE